MNELEKKLQEILQSMNDTFDISIDEKDEDDVVLKITLSDLKNDGSMFLEKFIGVFSPLIEQITNGEKQVVYEEGTGLVIRRVNDD